jgi:heme/copper-type cytochrome/quinol oxidase subunit 3
MMSITVRRSRSAQLVTDRPRHGAMGSWGLWLTLVVLAMFIAGLATAALYLEAALPRPTFEESLWPPAGIPIPPMGRAVLSFVLGCVGAGVLVWACVQLSRGALRSSALTIGISILVFGASAFVLGYDLREAPFGWNEHAYTSVYWVHTAFGLFFIAIAALLAVSVLLQLLTGLVDRERHLEAINAATYGIFAALANGVLLALVHLLPRGGGA